MRRVLWLCSMIAAAFGAACGNNDNDVAAITSGESGATANARGTGASDGVGGNDGARHTVAGSDPGEGPAGAGAVIDGVGGSGAASGGGVGAAAGSGNASSGSGGSSVGGGSSTGTGGGDTGAAGGHSAAGSSGGPTGGLGGSAGEGLPIGGLGGSSAGSSGTGNAEGGVATGNGGTAADPCRRAEQYDEICSDFPDAPPASLGHFCEVPERPAEDCVMVDGIDSGSFYCCPAEDGNGGQGGGGTGGQGGASGGAGGSNGELCGGVECSSDQVCCGPLECGYCINPNTDPPCAAECPRRACGPEGLECLDPILGFRGEVCLELRLALGPTEERSWACAPDHCATDELACSCAGTVCEDEDPLLRCTDADPETQTLQCIGGGVCASPDTPILTPEGERAIATVRAGDLVYSLDHGALVPVPVLRASQTPVEHHQVVRLTLENGTVLEISAPHPTADGRSLGELALGDRLDGVSVIALEVVPYRYNHTYDLLPASDSGTYVAGGVLLGSTLGP